MVIDQVHFSRMPCRQVSFGFQRAIPPKSGLSFYSPPPTLHTPPPFADEHPGLADSVAPRPLRALFLFIPPTCSPPYLPRRTISHVLHFLTPSGTVPSSIHPRRAHRRFRSPNSLTDLPWPPFSHQINSGPILFEFYGIFSNLLPATFFFPSSFQPSQESE